MRTRSSSSSLRRRATRLNRTRRTCHHRTCRRCHTRHDTRTGVRAAVTAPMLRRQFDDECSREKEWVHRWDRHRTLRQAVTLKRDVQSEG